jgi:hypothetical protein
MQQQTEQAHQEAVGHQSVSAFFAFGAERTNGLHQLFRKSAHMVTIFDIAGQVVGFANGQEIRPMKIPEGFCLLAANARANMEAPVAPQVNSHRYDRHLCAECQPHGSRTRGQEAALFGADVSFDENGHRTSPRQVLTGLVQGGRAAFWGLWHRNFVQRP